MPRRYSTKFSTSWLLNKAARSDSDKQPTNDARDKPGDEDKSSKSVVPALGAVTEEVIAEDEGKSSIPLDGQKADEPTPSAPAAPLKRIETGATGSSRRSARRYAQRYPQSWTVSEQTQPEEAQSYVPETNRPQSIVRDFAYNAESSAQGASAVSAPGAVDGHLDPPPIHNVSSFSNPHSESSKNSIGGDVPMRGPHVSPAYSMSYGSESRNSR